MATVAKVGTISGKQGPTLRFSDKGTAYAKFSIRVKPYIPKDQPQPEPVYYDVTAFGSLAEHICACLEKGDRVVVIGEGKVEEWEDRATGEKRSKKVIVASDCGPEIRYCGVDVHREKKDAPASAQPAYNGEPF